VIAATGVDTPPGGERRGGAEPMVAVDVCAILDGGVDEVAGPLVAVEMLVMEPAALLEVPDGRCGGAAAADNGWVSPLLEDVGKTGPGPI
jgi:hypothetical protein